MMGKAITKSYKLIIIIIDLILINLSYLTAFFMKFGFSIPMFNLGPYLNAMPFITIAALVYFDMFGMIKFYRVTVSEALSNLVKLVALLSITTVSITYFLQGFSFPRSVLLGSAFIMFIYLSLWRVFLLSIRQKLMWESNAMIIGSQEELKAIGDKITSDKAHKIAIKYEIDVRDADLAFGRLDEVGEVILCSGVPDDFKVRMIKECIERKKVVYAIPQLFEISLNRSRTIQFEDMPAFIIDRLGLTREQRFFKRAFDIVLSLIGLIISSPIMLISAILIKATSPGPVIFSQERVTEGNRVFKIYKFRTMVNDAEKTTGPVISSLDDPRVTPIGSVLRKLKIDELPQLFNILKGDMSFVGPRPERPVFADRFNAEIPTYKYRTLVKAGLTGYAQVYGKYDTSAEDKLRYDLLYIRSYSILLDIKLLLNTVFALFRGKRNYQRNGRLEAAPPGRKAV